MVVNVGEVEDVVLVDVVVFRSAVVLEVVALNSVTGVVDVEPVVVGLAVVSLFVRFLRFEAASEMEAVPSVASVIKCEAPPHACTEMARAMKPAKRVFRFFPLEKKTGLLCFIDTLAVKDMWSEKWLQTLCVSAVRGTTSVAPDGRTANSVKRRKKAANLVMHS